MPQSLAKLVVHMVFSTREREPFIDDRVRESLHRYMAAILKDCGCAPLLINSVEDHAHVLFELSRTTTVAQIAEKLKGKSSLWIKTQGSKYQDFAWQTGYGAFSVSPEAVEAARSYVATQREHHANQSYQSEYRTLLAKHGLIFDERYVWD
jgi:REP element-mobilizing transposase RayT